MYIMDGIDVQHTEVEKWTSFIHLIREWKRWWEEKEKLRKVGFLFFFLESRKKKYIDDK